MYLHALWHYLIVNTCVFRRTWFPLYRSCISRLSSFLIYSSGFHCRYKPAWNLEQSSSRTLVLLKGARGSSKIKFALFSNHVSWDTSVKWYQRGTHIGLLGLGQYQTAGWCQPHPLCHCPSWGCRGQTSLKCCAASQAGGAPLRMGWSDSWPSPCPPLRALTQNLKDPSGRSDNFMCIVAR